LRRLPMTESDWLASVLSACVAMGVNIHRRQIGPTFNHDIAQLLRESYPKTPLTEEVTNLLSSVAVTHHNVIANHEVLQTALLERLVLLKHMITQATTTSA